jgi:hypothetical protein
MQAFKSRFYDRPLHRRVVDTATTKQAESSHRGSIMQPSENTRAAMGGEARTSKQGRMHTPRHSLGVLLFFGLPQVAHAGAIWLKPLTKKLKN